MGRNSSGEPNPPGVNSAGGDDSAPREVDNSNRRAPAKAKGNRGGRTNGIREVGDPKEKNGGVGEEA